MYSVASDPTTGNDAVTIQPQVLQVSVNTDNTDLSETDPVDPAGIDYIITITGALTKDNDDVIASDTSDFKLTIRNPCYYSSEVSVIAEEPPT